MSNEQTQVSQSPEIPEKLPYVAPILVNLGDVRDLTLGGSPGSGDSGNPGAQRF